MELVLKISKLYEENEKQLKEIQTLKEKDKESSGIIATLRDEEEYAKLQAEG